VPAMTKHLKGAVVTLDTTTKPTHDDDNGKKVVFAGWTEAQDTKIYAQGDTLPSRSLQVTMPEADKTVYAVYGYDINGDGQPDVDQDTYLITFDANGGNAVTPSDMKTNIWGKLNALPTPTRSGNYRFDGWYTQKDSGNKIDTNTVFTANTTLYAHWASTGGGGDSRVTYTITATAGAGGTISTGQYVYVKAGDSAGFSFTPNKGYQISEVLVNGKSIGAVNTYTFTNVQSNQTIHVNFKKAGEHTNPQTGIELNKEDHTGYMKGYPSGEFGPNRAITRAEVIALFSRLVKEKPEDALENQHPFIDVKAEDWYASAVAQMQKYKIIAGYPDGSFKGKQAISRAEFATIIARFEDLTLDKPNPFTDVSDSHWAKDSIVSVANKGWVSGYPDGSFQPEKKITRSEVVSIVNRILERNGDKEYIQGQQQQLMEQQQLM
ncbi:S-layer homology domain-containing protein, partial [Clostridium cadaveris]|uniref:S-layer homology domain-containing protein n=1 Tax=Clostridium cadaveris TaxID=1529 RepID=UPI0015B6CBA2